MKRSVLPFVVAVLACPTVLAQGADPAQFPGFDPHPAVRAFLDANGPLWQARWSEEHGTPALLFGGSRELLPASRGTDPAALETAARALVDELAPALGFDTSSLELIRVKSLEHLAAAGTSPKMVVEFRQVTRGVAVHHATLNVLFDTQGRLLAVANGALPHVAQAPILPEVDEAAALELATAAFARDTGFAVARFERGEYVLFPEPVAPGKSLVRPTAAYVFKLDAGLHGGSGATPVIRSYAVAATGAARVLGSWSHVHNAEIMGFVNGWGQIGNGAYGYEAPLKHELRDMRVSGPGLTTTWTDSAGDFEFTGVAGPTLLTVDFEGQWSRVVNQSGATSSLSALATPGVPIQLTFNPGQAELQNAEVNAHYFANLFRDWIEHFDPLETNFNFQQVENVNFGLTCNAYYDGTSTNFYVSGAGCPNTAYSTVVWHEVGHWANDVFGTYNADDGTGEGAADCWAMYMADDPVIGKDFFGPGVPIRTGENTTQFCGDGNPYCYGASHLDAEPLMGAIWKVRSGLKNGYGTFTGGDIASHLLLAWFQAYNDLQLTSIIVDHWMVLDDNDGNLDNGTPHGAPIIAAFAAQGFPLWKQPPFSIHHTQLGVVNSEQIIPIQCTVDVLNGPLDSVKAHWSNDEGLNWHDVNLVPQGGTAWKGYVPGHLSPELIIYWLEASGPQGTAKLPKTAPASVFYYDVGTVVTHAFWDFEPISDEGWTHGANYGIDEWQHGVPQGQWLDPSAAASGLRCWGMDLGVGTNGFYAPNSDSWLLSPSLNFTGKTNLRLRFQRWLGVEMGFFDAARIRVNGSLVFQNPVFAHASDEAWDLNDISISADADNNPDVRIRFELTADEGIEFGGWTIDDVSIVSVGPVSPTQFISYGAGVPGTAGKTPLIAGSGEGTPGGLVTLNISNGKPNAQGALFVGIFPASLPFKGGTFLVGSPNLLISLNLNAAGALTLPGAVPSDPVLYGLTVHHQYWCNDAAAVKGKAGSAGLKYTIK